MSKTEYIVVDNTGKGKNERVAKLLDEGYTLALSWVAGDAVHHILTLEIE